MRQVFVDYEKQCSLIKATQEVEALFGRETRRRLSNGNTRYN